MPSADQDKRVQVAVETVARRDGGPNLATNVNKEIQESLAFRYNGQELFAAIPSALTAIGATSAVMFSDAARNTTLKPGKEQFRYIRVLELQGALQQSCGLGQQAFMKIQKSMESIKQISRAGQQTANELIEVVSDPQAMQKMLRPFFQKIRSGSGQCYSQAKEMDEALDQWLLNVCEIHAACISMDSTNEEKLQAVSIDLLACRARVNYESEKGSDTKGFTANLEKQMAMTTATFQNTSGSFPAGWTILDHQVMTGLVDSFVTALNQTLLVIHENVIPMAKVDPSVGLFKSRILSSGGNSATNAPPPPIPQPQHHKYSSDPAYSQVERDMPFFVLVQQILSTGPNGNVNWKIAQADAAQAVKVVNEALTSAAKSFSAIASTDEPSVKYSNTITTVKQITTAIISEVQGGKSPPADDSSVVKEWKNNFAKAYNTALEMFAFAKTLSGIATQSLPLMSDKEFGRNQTQDSQSAQAQAFVDSVVNSTYTATQASTSTGAIFQKSLEVLSKQQQSLGGVQADLKSLADPKATFAQIRKVLLNTIITIITIKKEVAKFVRCCKAVDYALGIVGTYAVDPLLERSNTNTSQLGGYTVLDLQRSTFIGSILWYTAYSKVLGYYYAAGWSSIFTEVGMQGLRLTEEIAQSGMGNDDGRVRNVVGSMNSWADTAQRRIAEATDHWKAGVTTSLQERLQALVEQSKALPPSLAASKAIELGSGAVRTVAEQALEANFNNSTLAKFVTK